MSKVNVNNIDFNAIAAEVTAQSQEFASMSVNGTTTLSCTDANDSIKRLLVPTLARMY